MRTLLLVRNAVTHDTRVLRAARLAEATVGGGTLVIGVATSVAPAGETTVEGVRVLRLSIRVSGSARTSSAAPPAKLPQGDAPAKHTWTARAGRVFHGAAFAWQALRVARRERPELVHANDLNTMWSAVAIKLVCRARVVYDSHELWADRNGRSEWRPWLLASEALLVRIADAVVTASPGYADALAARYLVSRPTVIRNIPDAPPDGTGTPETSTSPSERAASACEPSTSTPDPATPPLVIYVGGLLPGRGLEQTIDALTLAPTIRLRAVGPGATGYRTKLIEQARQAGVEDRVELAEPVPPAGVAALLRGATAGLCLIQPVCRSYELTLPNKLFEYASAGVPVLASDMPVIAALVRGEDLGEVVPADDPPRIAAGLERLVDPARRGQAARSSWAFAQANGWRAESEKLAALYSGVLAGERQA